MLSANGRAAVLVASGSLPWVALIRQILTVVGTALVARGHVEAFDIEAVIGALLTIGSVVWSVADKRSK